MYDCINDNVGGQLRFLRDKLHASRDWSVLVDMEGLAMGMICTNHSNVIAMQPLYRWSQHCSTTVLNPCTGSAAGLGDESAPLKCSRDPWSLLFRCQELGKDLVFSCRCCAPQHPLLILYMESRDKVSDPFSSFSLICKEGDCQLHVGVVASDSAPPGTQ